LKIAFDLDSSLSKLSYDELKSLLRSSKKRIEENLENFGESAEKLFLFKRLEELRSREKK